ncbi:hypothetical protein SmJEL517_g03919 [Synchytrium microbalum]|uniref:Ribosomal protein S21 n=1 Tax=Synchytrium microbalum TaxID=1806994 RepID=A0A507BUD3_9FUNG|nr:uncharacterized protein SmJEL517_g03919 [Synchytrium microbalum]TPX33100.1 hypothetical protein SmJEL517_g03919 [Synchytrium microbalum]
MQHIQHTILTSLLAARRILPSCIPLQYHIARHYRVHMPTTESRGRSVAVKSNSVTQAYYKLKSILDESKVRQTVRYQERFERKHDRKRRKLGETHWRKYMSYVKGSVKKAWSLKRRTLLEEQTYRDL